MTTVGLGAAGIPAHAEADRGSLVNADPVGFTPHLQDGAVKAIVQVGDRIFLGGSFTQVKENGAGKPVLTRTRLLSFNASTGAIDAGFAPDIDKGEVSALLPAPDGQSLYVGGSYSNINGTPRFKLARVNINTGAPIAGFQPQLDAKVLDLRLAGGRLYVSGPFSTVGGVAQNALAAVDPTTGAREAFFDIDIAGTQSGGTTSILKMDLSPDGTRLVAVGNFTTVGGQSRPQIAMFDLSGAQAQLAGWQTARYADACSASFDTYMRDVDFSPDGAFFVVTTTGGHGGSAKLCDTHARWENVATGTGKQPTWVNWTGGDTSYAVEVTGNAVYVGGHFRWANNPYAADRAGQGAVSREGIAALDPANGLPFTWNPGRTRGVGVFDLLATPQGLWMGSDTDEAGGEWHQKVAMFPTAGGKELPALNTGALPGNIYYAGGTGLIADNYLRHRSFDGTTAGAPVDDPTGGIDWRTTRGAFMISGVLYHGSSNGAFVSRSFDGGGFGPAEPVDTADQLANMTTWHGQVPSIKGMFYADGKVYYTRGTSALYYRYFTPESRVVGALELTATGNLPGVNWSNVGGMFTAGGKLYYVDTADGKLRSLALTDGVPSGTPAVVDESDWRGRATFLFSGTANQAPVADFTRTCAELSCSFNASASDDPDGTITTYDWDFGDGENATGATPDHVYDQAGTYTVKLTVTDDRGSSDSAQQSVTVAPDQVGISFRGTDGYNANTDAATVNVPAGVQAGDGMLLILTHNATGVTPTPPSGWTQVGRQDNGRAVSTVWRRTAVAGDAGTAVQVGLSGFAKADLRILAYADTGATPVAVAEGAADSADTASHPAPDVTVANPGSWVVTYWADKSSTTTAWTAPAAGTVRGTSIGSGSGRVTSLVVDSGGAVPAGAFNGLSATTDTPSRAQMWTIVLNR
ncbi:PKD domain-containing protein [Actinomadura sp. 9N407]|uniref:PKD domain-containing protein n=1 Tax=Actinomadura sp. 9N407 TaxID=3375154 RepID=UPI0037A9FDBF